jgi:Na+-translocating ferredoxin:NAD+ oxidoreductase RNF subunit RnfB
MGAMKRLYGKRFSRDMCAVCEAPYTTCETKCHKIRGAREKRHIKKDRQVGQAVNFIGDTD